MPEFSPVEPEVLNLVADLIESYHQHLWVATCGSPRPCAWRMDPMTARRSRWLRRYCG
jgi:hypothetical protein